MITAVLHLDEGPHPALEAGDQMRRGVAHHHDIADPHPAAAGLREGVRIELFTVAEHKIDLGHGGVAVRVYLDGAAGDDDAGVGRLSPGAADRLARLALGLGGHRAGVYDDGVVLTPGMAAHDLGFIGVEAAAEGQDFQTHDAASSGSTP